MADKQVSALNSATALSGTELAHIVQGGNSRKTTTGDIAALAHIQSIDVGILELDDTGGSDISTALQALIGMYSVIRLPAGTFYAALDIDSPTTIIGAGEGLTILTTEALTSASTITVNADLVLRDLTVKAHQSNANGKTITHAGDNAVRAINVTFDGVNHDPATGLSSVGDYRHCTFHTPVQPAGLGARCWSPLAVFTDCVFTGARTIEARDSQFYFCRIGDSTSANAVHMPDGALDNSSADTSYTGEAEFHDCIVRASGTGITEGNAGHAILRRVEIITGGNCLYSRSQSTFDAEDCNFVSTAGTAVAFSDSTGPGAIARAGESVLKRCRLESQGALSPDKALSIPTTSDTYPAAIGNVRLVDCQIIGGEDEISPKTSTYHVFQTERNLAYPDTLVFASNGETKRIRFKQNEMLVIVYGSDAAKTGCFISHLDAVTGQSLPDGMAIYVRYGGTSSRFVTFAQGATGDSGAMYFADAASTLTTSQNGIYKFRLQGTTWRQIDG